MPGESHHHHHHHHWNEKNQTMLLSSFIFQQSPLNWWRSDEAGPFKAICPDRPMHSTHFHHIMGACLFHHRGSLPYLPQLSIHQSCVQAAKKFEETKIKTYKFTWGTQILRNVSSAWVRTLRRLYFVFCCTRAHLQKLISQPQRGLYPRRVWQQVEEKKEILALPCVELAVPA